jgi:hypothetical protein
MLDTLIKTLIAAALLASGAAVLALLLAAAGVQLLSLPHAIVLIGSTAVAGMGHLVIQISAQQRYGTKPFGRLLKRHTPTWMRWVCNGLGLTGFGLWIYFTGVHGNVAPSGGVPSVLAGAFCLFLAPPTAMAFYAYSKVRPQLQRRCTQGHELPVDAAYCPECGEQA